MPSGSRISRRSTAPRHSRGHWALSSVYLAQGMPVAFLTKRQEAESNAQWTMDNAQSGTAFTAYSGNNLQGPGHCTSSSRNSVGTLVWIE
jgi:hypothetical protein